MSLLLSACGNPPTSSSEQTSSPSAAVPVATSPVAANTPTEIVEPTSTPQPTATTEPTATPTPEPAEVGTSRSNPLALGTELGFETWAVTITEVIRGEAANQAIATANQFNDPPREGFEYVLISLDLANIGTKQEAQDTSFAVDVRLTGDRNVLYGPASVVKPKPLEGQLFPGGTTSGQIAFEVPKEEQNLMLRVQESFSFDSDTQRVVAIMEGAKLTPNPELSGITPTDIGTSRNAPAKRGETVTTDAYEVTVVEVVRGSDAAKLVEEANEFNDPPEQGKEYVAVRLKVRYIGADEPDNAQGVDGSLFKITGEKNVVYEKPSVVSPSPDLDATLFPGGETEGWEVFSVAENESQLTLIFEPLFSLSDNDTRFLALE